MPVTPLTVRLLLYGQKANVAAIRRRAEVLLKDEHGRAAPEAMVNRPLAEVVAEVAATCLVPDVALAKPPPSHIAMVITLAEVNERLTVEWLTELPAAKTCVVLAAWTSLREQAAWQMLIAQGGRWSESRPLAT